MPLAHDVCKLSRPVAGAGGMTVLMCDQDPVLDLSREKRRLRRRQITGLLLPLEAGGAVDVRLTRRTTGGPGDPSVTRFAEGNGQSINVNNGQYGTGLDIVRET